MKLLRTVAAVIWAGVATATAQSDEEASAVIDTYLKALQILELPEGRQMLAQVAWPNCGSAGMSGTATTLPTVTKTETIFQTRFETDVPAVPGFKRVVNCEVKTDAMQPTSEKYLVVAYPDNITKKWKVLCFIRLQNFDEATAYTLRHLNDTAYGTPSVAHRFLAFQYSAAGKLRLASATYRKAAELNRTQPTKYAPQSQFDMMVTAFDRIIPK